MITFEDCVLANKKRRKHKKQSVDEIKYEIHRFNNLREMTRRINNRSYKPSSYAFVTYRPQPREIFACNVGMRDVHHYIDARLRPILESQLTDRTFNNRVGYGMHECVNRVRRDIQELSENYTKDCWCISVDLQGYFPNANRAIVCQQLTDLIRKYYNEPDKNDLIYMIELSTISDPTENCELRSPIEAWENIPDHKSVFKKPKGIGAAIGHLIWQNGMNFYINEIDKFAVSRPNIRYCRFVDDMYFVTIDKNLVFNILPKIREMLSQYGCTMHPKKFYCQHYKKGVRVLGYFIKKGKMYVRDRTVTAIYDKIKNLNRVPFESKIEEFISSMNSYCGIMNHGSNYSRLQKLISLINPKWFTYVHFDKDKLHFVVNDDYSYRKKLIQKQHEHTKRNNKARGKTAGTQSDHVVK